MDIVSFPPDSCQMCAEDIWAASTSLPGSSSGSVLVGTCSASFYTIKKSHLLTKPDTICNLSKHKLNLPGLERAVAEWRKVWWLQGCSGSGWGVSWSQGRVQPSLWCTSFQRGQLGGTACVVQCASLQWYLVQEGPKNPISSPQLS